MSTTADSKKPDKPGYKDTLNLPATNFAMKAQLVVNEPIRLAKWQEKNLYAAVQAARAGGELWILHDGPPFANGDIHIGHVTNKTLKDVVIKSKTMAGHRTPYVPGWDCHGLPIEHKIQQELGPKLREMATVDVRKKCYDYASKYAAIQSQQFERLGVLGDWAHPYMTMEKGYEASTLEVFAKFVEAGLVYKQLKPVQWSIANQTALADAELEYKDVDDTTVFVEFLSANPGAAKAAFNLRHNATVGYLIWTTTPWTLPGNLAIAAGPEIDYAFVLWNREGQQKITVIAEALVETVMKKAGVAEYSVIARAKGSELAAARLEYLHPFVERTGRVVVADYVTTTDGTGLVHTAPGHGEEDYATGLREKLEVYCPVLPNGRYDTSVPNWLQGMLVWEANKLIPERLKESGHLLATEKYRHPYPHDWRSKTPVITRATEQWFIAVDRAYSGDQTMRQRAMAARNTTRFTPAWGGARLEGMLANRPDWCISRQRAWGLPIPVFYNEQGEALLTPESVRAVAKRFDEVGSDAWFTETPEQILAGYDPGPKFPKDKLRKERDIFDVWFESGSSWNAVLNARDGAQREPHRFPADMYLEGSDQHRGWFQLSLLACLGATGTAPYRQVLTHGFIVKPDGTKVSKSDKEYVTATDEINRHGADLLRLWVSSMDYQGDMPASPKVIQEFGEKYLKLRNTVRYLLSNLSDFDANTQQVEIPDHSLDGWAMHKLDGLIRDVKQAYEGYQLHTVFKLLYEFCAVEISAVYGNAMKDRLYCDLPNSPLRRRSQTVMWHMADGLIRLLAPILVFTADEAWEHLPRLAKDMDLWSVHLALFPTARGHQPSAETLADWRTLLQLRDSANGQIDILRKQQGMNRATDAELVYSIPDAGQRSRLASYGVDLEDLAVAGCHSFVDGKELAVTAVDRRNDYPACARSYKRRKDVGADPNHPELSPRDAAAVTSLKAM
jgi:isoleucyl-tRNA synthetase